ncbi:MAG: helix-turn-helix domain-containing protein [Candidatus Omnitrophica bacterium]|nr:helix-turn-helix domain-containing protein [Candidatus Omnitrophota bacterium]
MGVTYKLKPGVLEFILEKKRSEPKLSCRQISRLILDKFQIKLSKSSINTVLKNAGLSQPVGRPRTKRKYTFRKPQFCVSHPELISEKESLPLPIPPPTPILRPTSAISTPLPTQEIPLPSREILELPQEGETNGAILLKAADYLISGSQAMAEVIRNHLSLPEENLRFLTEGLIYSGLFLHSTSQELSLLAGKKISLEILKTLQKELSANKTIALDIYRSFSGLLQEARGIKVVLSEGEIFYLDSQLHTVWSTPHIPYDFSLTLSYLKRRLNKSFLNKQPFIFLMAPGYDTPTKEFFSFILALEAKEKQISKLTLFGNKFEDLETIQLERQRYGFIFGLWPWQFTHQRKVISLGEFKSYQFPPLKGDLYLAEIMITLSQPTLNQTLTLKGYALKKSLNEKTRLIILSNLTEEKTSKEIVGNYLLNWPNLEEGFQDYSRKIEYFTYMADSQHFLSQETLPLEGALPEDLKGVFDYYLRLLDLYVRWRFLPSGYKDKDFSKEQFYNLNCHYHIEKDLLFVTFLPPPDYPLLKDLEYGCRRINEREIFFYDKRLWCEAERGRFPAL